jgi:hypothetical protein
MTTKKTERDMTISTATGIMVVVRVLGDRRRGRIIV